MSWVFAIKGKTTLWKTAEKRVSILPSFFTIHEAALQPKRQVRPPITVRASRVIFPILPAYSHTVWTASDAHAMPPAAQQGRVQQAEHPTVSHEVAVGLLEHRF